MTQPRTNKIEVSLPCFLFLERDILEQVKGIGVDPLHLSEDVHRTVKDVLDGTLKSSCLGIRPAEALTGEATDQKVDVSYVPSPQQVDILWQHEFGVNRIKNTEVSAIESYFETSNFSQPAKLANGTGNTTNGNLGNQTNQGPPQRVLDASLFKDFPISERYRFQLRAEGFNIANTPQYDVTSIGFTLGTSNFGSMSRTLPLERKFQLALRLQF